ncbi:MAG: hypothetical protein IH795_11725 [Bacteroidetes bacterium]|nr:hypothetical protein [Bacteroidota bacterium]
MSGFFLIFIFNINSVVSQTSGGGAPGAVAPTAPSPGDFPPTIIYPEDDLNQFENTRLKETKTEFRHGQSTLNPKITRKSNAEVNAEIEKRRAERLEALEKENAVDDQTTDGQKPGTQDSAGSVNDTTDFSAGGTSDLFRWTDKDGIVHVTDNLGSVPPEYRDQAYNSK